MNIGILGAARVAVYAMIEPARAVPGCHVAAVAARDPARAEAYAAKHGIPKVHPAYDALLADPAIDLVYVATPPHNHAELAHRALDAGKALLVEKPFAMDAGEAERVFEQAREASVPVFEAMHSLHHPLRTHLQTLLREGAVGEVLRITARFDAPIAQSAGEYRWQPELGGGALMDLGVYPLAWCRHLAGEAFDIVSAAADVSGVDTRFDARLLFPRGVEATIGGSFYGEHHRAPLRIEGTLGEIDIDNFLAPHRGHRIRLARAGRSSEDTVAGPTTYEAQLAAVRASVVEGARFPLPPDDYVRSMQAIDRIREAWSTA